MGRTQATTRSHAGGRRPDTASGAGGDDSRRGIGGEGAGGQQRDGRGKQPDGVGADGANSGGTTQGRVGGTQATNRSHAPPPGPE